MDDSKKLANKPRGVPARQTAEPKADDKPQEDKPDDTKKKQDKRKPKSAKPEAGDKVEPKPDDK